MRFLDLLLITRQFTGMQKLKLKAKRSAYFKKWYEEKGRERRKRGRRKDYSDRNKRIYQLYMDQSKHLSMGAIAKMFHITPPRVHKIIKNEEKRLKDSKSIMT